MYIVANQLELSNGVRRDRGECLVDAEQVISPPILQKRGTLYIITETETMAIGKPRPGDIDLCKEVQETILHDFYNTTNTSITGALRHALEKANQLAFNYNSTLMPPERRGVGLTVALVRGNEVYTGQLMPTRAYLFHQGEVKTLPANALTGLQNRSTDQLHSVARQATDPQSTQPLPRPSSLPALGRYTSIEPILTRNIFEPGDLLVLCSSSYTRLLQDEDLQWILDQPDSRGALINLSDFSRRQNINDGYAIIIGTREEMGARPSFERQPTDSGWKNTAEGMAGAVSLLAARLNPTGPRPTNQRPTERPADRNSDTGYLDEDAFESEVAPPLETRREITRPQKFDTIQPAAALTGDYEEADSDDPLAPMTKEKDAAWIKREDDDLNRPAFLKGRSLTGENPAITGSKDAITSPGPIKPKPFTSRLGGDNTITPSGQGQGTRKFSYTDASHDTNLNIPPAAARPNSARPYVKSYRNPELEAPEVFEDEPVEVRKRWLGKRPPRPEQASVRSSSPSSPYFDMVSGDGYAPPAPKRWSFNALSVKNRSFIMAGVGLVMGLAVVLLIISVAGSTITGSKTKALQFVQDAETKRTNALSMAETDPAGARSLLEQAATDLDAARKQKADLPEIVTTTTNLKQTLYTINKVTIPADIRVALDLTTQGAGVSLSRAVISPKGDQLYLMDTGRGVIYSADVLGAIKTILKGGDKAGNSVFGKPVTMVARADGGIIVVDDTNLAWIYNKANGTWAAQQLGGSPKGQFKAASYQDNLYLTGTGTGQILKYNAGNYTGKPDEWVNPSLVPSLNLDKASGFAIDGLVYALTKEGHLYQMSRSGKPAGEVVKEYDINKDPRLGPAFNSPYILNVGSLEYPYIFVLDGENRVLQFNKATGAFIQQFQSADGGSEFKGLQDIAIDEGNKKVYVVGADKVYVYNLTDAPVTPVAPATTPGATTVPVGTIGGPTPARTPGAASNATIIATQTTAKS